jgi:hypothetical protein
LTNVDDLFICRKKPYFELRELWKPRELREARELSFEILPCNISPNS